MGTTKLVNLVPLFDLKSWFELPVALQGLQIGGTKPMDDVFKHWADDRDGVLDRLSRQTTDRP